MTTVRKTDLDRGERIKHVRTQIMRMKSQEKFAEALTKAGKQTTRGAVGNWELGKEVGLDSLSAISLLAGVDLNWLVNGGGLAPDDAPKSAGRRSVVDSFDPDVPDEETPEQLMTIGSETGARGIPSDASAQLDATGGMGGGGLTIVSEGVPGRHGMTFAAEHVRDYWRLPPAVLIALGLAAHDVAILPVQGDSMLPTLNEGDVVFIDTRHRWPSPSGLYAVLDEIGGIVVKRLEVSSPPGAEQQMVTVISDNPRHKPKEWRAEDLFIVGRVLRKFGVVN